MNYDKALRAAESMMDTLRTAVSGRFPAGDLGAIAIAGSLRRASKTDYDEIDLIMVPDLSPLPLPRAEFGKPIPSKRDLHKTKIDKLLDDMTESGRILIRSRGERSVKFLSMDHEINFDLYIVRPPGTWGVLFTIRTGPAEFGHWIVTRRSGRGYIEGRGHVQGGALPDGYRVEHGAVWEGEEKLSEKLIRERGISPIGFDTEEGFLDFLGLGWIEPGDRRARWGSAK